MEIIAGPGLLNTTSNFETERIRLMCIIVVKSTRLQWAGLAERLLKKCRNIMGILLECRHTDSIQVALRKTG
jgi:hypothetical protein